MERPKVSVIVPVYNTSQYLDECLESLVSQTLHNIEIICINDASTDNSLEILEKWKKKDERIKIINNQTNLMLGATRNIGMKAAVGEYLGFVDSDDYVSNDFYKSLSEVANNDVDVITSNLLVRFGSVSKRVNQFDSSVDFTKQESIKKSIAAYGCMLCSSIFRRTYVSKKNFQFAENVFFEDFPIVQTMFLLANHITVVDNNSPFYHYRINPTSILHSPFTDNKFSDRLYTCKMMLDNFKRDGIFEIYKDEFCYRFYKVFFYNTLYLLLFRRGKYSYKNVGILYREYKQKCGIIPKKSFMKDAPRYKIYNLIGKYPFLGRLYLLHEHFHITGYLKQFFTKRK